jgi:ABC-type spermidine/putrescine transport system permease subunit II
VLLVLLMLPAMIPTMIYSIASYFAAVQAGLLGTRASLVLAHGALAIPFVVIICSTALGGIKVSIDQAAQSLGARRFTRFYRITLPLILPSVLTSALVAFQTSFDEVVVALFLSGVQTRTLPKLMWQASTMEVSPIIPAASVAVLVVVIVVAGALMGLSRLQRLAR